MKRYYIRYTDDDGEDLNLLVDARTKYEAVRLSQKAYGVCGKKQPEAVWELPPLSKTPRHLPWYEERKDKAK